MTLRLIGKPITTAEINTSTVSQRVEMPALKNVIIRGVTIGLIHYNNPTYTSVHLDMYDDDNGVPRKKIATSDSFTKAEISTLANAFKIVGFTFADIPVKAGSSVHFSLGGVGYTGNSTSHLSWRNAYPDPQFITGVTLAATAADNHPLEICVVGAEL